MTSPSRCLKRGKAWINQKIQDISGFPRDIIVSNHFAAHRYPNLLNHTSYIANNFLGLIY